MRFGGTYGECSPEPPLEALKVGLVWSVPISSKANDRASPNRAETYSRWGGARKRILGGEGPKIVKR